MLNTVPANRTVGPAHADEPTSVPTPCFVLDIARLRTNLEAVARIRTATGCKILLATKAFALPAVFPLMRTYLDGTTASGLNEAILGREEFGKAVHVYSPAYTAQEMEHLVTIASHVYFNSAEQLARFAPIARTAGRKTGLRVNPGFSHAVIGGSLYDPCVRGSRFGEPASGLDSIDWSEIDVFHVHALCESLHDGSVGLIEHVCANFAPFLEKVKVVNFGGGHFLNAENYDHDALIDAINTCKKRFNLDVILEPGAGLVVNAGDLHAEVLALHQNDGPIAILDTSASTHMPDILEVPYRPTIRGAGPPGMHAHTYTLAGKTCMSGDVIGAYSFPEPLRPGTRIVFADQMHYSFVKANTFNGITPANLAILYEDGRIGMLSDFGYEDFRQRLGKMQVTPLS